MENKSDVKKKISNETESQNDEFTLSLIDVNEGMDLTKLDGRE